MRIYLFLTDDGRVDGVSSSKTDYPVEVDESHGVLQQPNIYTYKNGVLEIDEDYRQELIKKEREKNNKPSDDELNAIAIMELTEKILGR